jgi:hypothetical protein
MYFELSINWSYCMRVAVGISKSLQRGIPYNIMRNYFFQDSA